MNRRAWSVVLAAVLLLAGASSLAGKDLTAEAMVAKAKKSVELLSLEQAKALFDAGGVLFLDVREPNETSMGHLPGAMLMPRGLLEFNFPGKVADKSTRIVAYCKSSGRAILSAYTLKRMGYKGVAAMQVGWPEWEKAGYPVE